jgi:hypothetical protein
MGEVMNQRQGVYAAVVAVMGEPNGRKMIDHITDQQTSEVKELLVRGLTSGQIDYKGGPPDDVTARKYVGGLLNNWLRKDLNLNGGSPYVTKNPGSRTGSGDEQLKNLKLLLAKVEGDNEATTAVRAAIAQREAELKPVAKTVDWAKLPAGLQHLASKLQ